MKILALELSTSSAKAMLYSTEVGVLGTKNKEYDPTFANTITIDADRAAEEVLALGKALLAEFNVSDVDIIALSSTWYHGVLFLDEEKKPLTRVITWANTDAAPTVKKYKEQEGINAWVYQKTGNPCHSIYALWKWVHLRETNNYGVLESTRNISSLPEYFFQKMTDGKRVCSKMTASASGFLNIHTLDWDDEILEFCGLTRANLCELKDEEHTEPMGKYAAEKLGLKEGIPVIVCGADGGMNQIAEGALKKGNMTLSVGTSAALRLAYDEPILPKNNETWCYYGAEGKRIVGAATSGAGNCVEWYAKKVLDKKYSYKELDAYVEREFKNMENAPIYLPFNFGERCPGWNDLRGGRFYEMRGDSNFKNMYFAVLEGVLFNIYQCYNILCENAMTPKNIFVSGGIVKSKVWLDMLATMLNREILVSEVEHASIMGAVVMAIKVKGGLKSLEDYQPRVKRKVLPGGVDYTFCEKRFKKYLEYYDK